MFVSKLMVERFLSEPQIVIIHGGLGKRLKHITGDMPKGLLEVYGKRTLIDYEIDLWNIFNLPIVVLLSQFTQPVMTYISNNRPDIRAQYSLGELELGKNGRIQKAIGDGLINKDRPVIVTFPDDFKLNKHLPRIVIESHIKGREYGCIATDVMVPGTKYQYGSSIIGEHGIVTQRVEKPFIEKPTSIGVYVFDPEALEMIRSYPPYTDFEPTLLNHLCTGRRLYSCMLDEDVWIPVNDDKGYGEVRQELLKRNGQI